MKKVKAVLMGVCLTLTTAIAQADMVVIVSSKNPTDVVPQDVVKKIFLGKLKLFPDGRNAIPLDLPDESDGKEYFYQVTTNKNNAQLKSYWAKLIFTGAGAPSSSVNSQEEMVRLVAENPNTIGYVDKTLVDATVKVVWEVQ
ncbi:MAG: phosphate ABC transporter substrate-binding protein [Hahellaceae bacterium]|nr:phosphate ABC transporter substrate-binding protein [Hahellaceae bacterium]